MESSVSYFAGFLQFFEPNKNRFPLSTTFRERKRERKLVLLIFILSSLLIFCFINRTIRTVSSISVLNGFLRLLYPLFLPTSYRPSEHKAERPLSHYFLEDIHHPSTQIFNKTSTASATQSLSSYAVPPMLCLIFHPIYSDHLRSPWFAFNAAGLRLSPSFPCFCTNNETIDSTTGPLWSVFKP